jgi:hypothetical protein
VAPSAVLTIVLQRKSLPEVVRPSAWCEPALLGKVVFFDFFFVFFVIKLPKILRP